MSEEKTYTLQTAGFEYVTLSSYRFFNENGMLIEQRPFPQHQPDQALQNYVDYHKCVNAKGEEFAPCQQFKRAYRSLCPNEWAAKWDEQVENGTFPASLKP